MGQDQQVGAAWAKLDVLAHGMEIDPSVAEFVRVSGPLALRKNVYNTPSWTDPNVPLPQEVRIGGLTVGVNVYGRSPWRLHWAAGNSSLRLEHRGGLRYDVQVIPNLALFAQHPETERIANLYGGTALAFFSPRSCYFFADGNECRFCSLHGTAKESGRFNSRLTEEEVAQTVRFALSSDANRLEQIMIVGGTEPDLDKGFGHHVALAVAVAAELRKAGLEQTVSVHISTMPPRDHSAIARLAEIANVHVMFNLEVWDERLFAQLCPGKAKDYGHRAIIDALVRLRDVIGPYRAHSLLVTGLEPTASMLAGARFLAAEGVSPIVNVYHSDRHSQLGMSLRPDFNELVAIARGMQDLYSSYPILPYWKNCGRNAIDAEAGLGLFRAEIPAELKAS